MRRNSLAAILEFRGLKPTATIGSRYATNTLGWMPFFR